MTCEAREEVCRGENQKEDGGGREGNVRKV